MATARRRRTKKPSEKERKEAVRQRFSEPVGFALIKPDGTYILAPGVTWEQAQVINRRRLATQRFLRTGDKKYLIAEGLAPEEK